MVYLSAKANESDRSTELLKKLKIDKDDERKSGDTRGSFNLII